MNSVSSLYQLCLRVTHEYDLPSFIKKNQNKPNFDKIMADIFENVKANYYKLTIGWDQSVSYKFVSVLETEAFLNYIKISTNYNTFAKYPTELIIALHEQKKELKYDQYEYNFNTRTLDINTNSLEKIQTLFIKLSPYITQINIFNLNYPNQSLYDLGRTIRQLPSLKIFSCAKIEQNKIHVNFVKLCLQNIKINNLNLGVDNLKQKKISEVTHTLSKLNLKKVSFYFENIAPKDKALVIKSLLPCRNLQTLKIAQELAVWERFGRPLFTEDNTNEYYQNIIKLFTSLPIKKLHFFDDITEEGSKILENGIANSSLENLILPSQTISTKAYMHLCKGIIKNNTLKEVSLRLKQNYDKTLCQMTYNLQSIPHLKIQNLKL